MNKFFSVGEVLGISEWLRGNEIVPLGLSLVLEKVSVTEQVPPPIVEEDDGLAELLNQVGSFTSEDSSQLELEDGMTEDLPLPPISEPPPSLSTVSEEDEEQPGTPEGILAASGVRQEADAADIVRAWMHYHEFVIVTSVEQLEDIVDKALLSGRCALDLETEGLDNRIYMCNPEELDYPFEVYWEGPSPALIPQTKHKIVGYCLSYDGHTGYYVPVRHRKETKDNVDVVGAGKAIKRLCLAAQPVLTPESFKVDPLGGPCFATPPRVKIYFHHAKFDQEFLYPVTGIDYWHPESFEDSLLLYYCHYTGDKDLGLKAKSESNLVVLDKEGKPILGYILKDPSNPSHEIVKEDPKGSPIPYKMIELEDLFLKGREIDFASLYPEEARRYACSDAICTYLHCESPLLKTLAQDRKYSNTYRLEKQVAQVLRWMERNRIKIDQEYVRSLFTEARNEATEYRNQIVSLAASLGWPDFDPNSTQQLSEFLFGNPAFLNIEPKPEKNEKSNQYKTDADTLEKLVEEHPNINPILLVIVKYRQVEKVIGTYLEGMLNNCDHNHELRYQFKQTGAPTGRFTAPAGKPKHGYGGIPIHGIPATYDAKKPKVATALRRAFVAREGYTMVKIDFAGEELRIVTNLSREPVWIKEFNEGTGDLHTITAKAFFGPEITKQQRQMGKCVHPDTIVFSGGQYKTLQSLGSFPSEEGFVEHACTLYDGEAEQPTTHLYYGGVKTLCHVIVTDGILTCTEDHRLLTQSGEWVKVKDLTPRTMLAPSSVPPITKSTEDTKLVRWSYLIGSTGDRVPEQVFEFRETALNFIAGLFDIHGKRLKKNLTWSTKNLVFAGQVATLLKGRGLPFTVSHLNLKRNVDYIRITLSVVASAELKGFTRRLSLVRLKVRRKEVRNIGGRVLKIVSTSEAHPCMDVTMGTEVHQYQANGFISHNSANFSLVYGGGSRAIMRATKCSEQEAARRKQNFDKSLPRFAEWVKTQKQRVKKDLGVATAFGRWMSIPNANSPDKAIAGACERYSLNYPIQGCLQSSSRVLTSSGYRRISDLLGLGSFTVWTGDKWATATAHPMGECQLAEITLSDGTIVRCDTRHKQLIVREDGYFWVDFADLKPGMKSATSMVVPLEFEPIALPVVDFIDFKLTPDLENSFWYWIGYYLGNGSFKDGALWYEFNFRSNKAQVSECISFWTACGAKVDQCATKTYHGLSVPLRLAVIVRSEGLAKFLYSLGLQDETSNTIKRVFDRAFRETLDHRKKCIQGIWDGNKYKVEERVFNTRVYSAYSYQRPILEDFKLLLRTVGVESKLRVHNHYGTLVYFLDAVVWMFSSRILSKPEGVRRSEMGSPRFLAKDLVRRGPWRPSAFRDCSNYHRFCELARGEQTSLYILQDLCNQLGVTLSYPIYAYKEIKSIEILPEKEVTYTLSVDDPLHRFDADGVITKNSGADVMKIAMVLLYKEFYRRGWMQDATARFMLTVHDEIVFEVKHEALMQVMPVLEHAMTEPGRMARPKWDVQLEVEPLIDLHWDPKYDYHKVMHGYIPEKGKNPGKDDIQVGDRWYQPIPEWLRGHLIPDYLNKGQQPQSQKSSLPEASHTTPVTTQEPHHLTLEIPPPPPSQPRVTLETRLTQLPPKAPAEEVFMYGLNVLTANTVLQVYGICIQCFDPAGMVLRLFHQNDNEILIDESLGVRVDPKAFSILMRDKNL